MSKEQTFAQSGSDTLILEKDTVASKIRNLLGFAANAIELITELKNHKISVAVFLDVIELFDENVAKQSPKDILELTDKFKLRLKMIKKRVSFVKLSNKWFAHIPDFPSEVEELEMVEGADTLCDKLDTNRCGFITVEIIDSRRQHTIGYWISLKEKILVVTSSEHITEQLDMMV